MSTRSSNDAASATIAANRRRRCKATPRKSDPRSREHGITPKKAYASERVQLPDDWNDNRFKNDRGELAGRPGFHIFGKCPSCDHGTSGVCATEYLAQEATEENPQETAEGSQSIGSKRLQADYQPWLQRFQPVLKKPKDAEFASKTQVTVLRCACTSNHEHAPAGTFGCGSEWLLRVTYNSNDSKKANISAVPATDAFHYWPAADAAAAEVPAALTTAQAAAKNWGAALAAVLALLGVSGLLASRATLQNLSTWTQVAFGIFAFLAVLAAALMLYQSNFASYGSPRIKEVLKPSDPWNADLDPLMQASASLRKLTISVWATGVSVAAALIAAGILPFVSPAAAPAISKITLTMDGITTTTPCGTVTFAPTAPAGKPPATTLQFTPNVKDGTTEMIELSNIMAIAAC